MMIITYWDSVWESDSVDQQSADEVVNVKHLSAVLYSLHATETAATPQPQRVRTSVNA